MDDLLRILLVDDNPDDRLLTIRELNREFRRLHVEQISDSDSFARALEAGGFDLVITDYQLRWGNGLEVLRAVKERYPDCPVIMFTATGNEEIAVEAMKKGLDDYILKSPKHFARIPVAVKLTLEKAEQRRALGEAESRYRDLFERVPIGLYRINLDGKILDANPALVEMLGYPDRELLLAASFKDIVSPGAEDLRELFDQLKHQDTVRDFILQVRRRDGTPIWVEIYVRAIRDEAGGILHYEGSMKDVTERKHLEEQLIQARKMEAIGRLAGGIAHDFNNLLTAITGYADLLLMRLGRADPLRRDVEEIKKAGERAASLTRQLLAFSRKQMLRPEILDLNRVISDMEGMLRRLIGEDIDLVTVLEPGLGRVEADPGQIEQVILNLAVNARDAMPQGGKLTFETANVDLDEAHARQHPEVRPGSYVMLLVSDTGVGMDEETKSHIFEPFFTTKKRGEGTGLGLSTVYGIVRQSGGYIWVDSKPGCGATFRIYLPRVDKTAETSEQREEPSEARRGSETILVVEDEDVVRELACKVLRESGYTVLEARDGEQALEVCKRHNGPIHLVIADVVMPGINGRELVERLMSLHPGVRALYTSGYTDDTIVRRGMLRLDVEFLRKPFTPSTLVRRVREVLDAPRG